MYIRPHVPVPFLVSSSESAPRARGRLFTTGTTEGCAQGSVCSPAVVNCVRLASLTKTRTWLLILFGDTVPSGSDIRDDLSHDRVHLPDVWHRFGRPMTAEALVSNGWSG